MTRYLSAEIWLIPEVTAKMCIRDSMETDEYAEEVAREKLGLVKDNETVFKKQQ